MSDVLLFTKTIIGSGDAVVTVEPRGNALRIKTRHGELFVRNENAESLGRALLEFAANAKRVRA